MNAHINNKTNPETLHHLQDLLSEGNDAKILNFVKTTFAEQLPTYINMAEETAQMHNTILKLQIDDLNNKIERRKMIQRVNESLKIDFEKLEEDEKNKNI